MSTVAIIAEYNPFHNGHLYHLNQAKEKTGAVHAVALMGGNFLQRGHAAMWDKYTRAQIALTQGIDLVLELPFVYATGSAYDFANGAINILNRLNHIDYLCFGAETAEEELLLNLAEILTEEPKELGQMITDGLSQGLSYPSARAKALAEYTKNPSLAEVLSSPNNILAVEYLCALRRSNSTIKPIVIQRKNAMYHDKNTTGSISSATALRELFSRNLSEAELFSLFKKEVPSEIATLIHENHLKKSPIYSDDLTPFLQEKRLFSNIAQPICDLNEQIANRLKSLPSTLSFPETVDKLKTKDITASRISRSLLHLIFNYTEEDRQRFASSGYAFYANILGLKKENSSLVREIASKATIPLITKKADFADILSDFAVTKDFTNNSAVTKDSTNVSAANKMWEYDVKSTELYNCLIYNRYGIQNENDFTVRLPIL